MTKKFFILTLVLLCFSLLAQEKETQETRSLNLDFEEFTTEGKPENWNVRGEGYEITVDKVEAYAGKASLCISGKSINESFGYASSRIPIKDDPGAKVRLRGYIKTENVTEGYAGLWCRVDSKEGVPLSFDNMSEREIAGTTPWKEYVIELDVPRQGKRVVFGALLSGTGKAWFDHLQITFSGVRPKPVPPKKIELEWIQTNAVPFKSADPLADHAELMPLKKMIGNRHIAALGEGTHGTSEFFKMKHRLTRFLAEEMGFTIFAIEANMPEARKVNQYILTGEGDPKEALKGLYFWTWNTAEVLAMIEWMREYNKSGKGQIQFYGFDMQFPLAAMESVTAFVKKADPEFVQPLTDHFKKITQLWKDLRKTRKFRDFDSTEWYEAAKKVYDHLTAQRPVYIKSFNAREVDWAIQDANVVQQAAEIYMKGKRSRDNSMAENLGWILAHSPKGSKVVTWAHNGHVSKDSSHYKPMGAFLNKQYGDDMIVFAFAFHQGTYTAWGKKGINIYGTSPSEPGSVEWFLKSSGIPNLILDLRKTSNQEAGSQWLNRELNFRSIGAVALENAFSKRKVTRAFDALIYFEKSTPSQCFRHGEKVKKQENEDAKKKRP